MSKQFNAEIVSVGTELLLGQIANTNAQWLSKKLAELGINVYHHSVVGDNLERVRRVFAEANERANIVIVTGGLGPTEDDLTREAFQLLSKKEMEIHAPSLEKIEKYFRNNYITMTPNNKRQARVFKGSIVLENPIGMAPGMIVETNQVTWIFLPGVPREMKQLTTEKVLPYLEKKTGKKDVIQSQVLKFIGIGESTLEHELIDLIQTQTNPTIAPLAQNDGVVIRITAKGENKEHVRHMLDETRKKILSRVGDYYYGTDEETIEERLISLLKEKELTIASAESLTGGLFMSRLISVSGASEVCLGGIIGYDTNVKRKLLGVSDETISSVGTVSEACALEMARGAKEKLQSSLAISFTGVAGPAEVEGKPAGTVYIGICSASGKSEVAEFSFQGERNTVRERAVKKGLEMLYHYLKKLE